MNEQLVTVGTVVMVHGYTSNGADTHCAIVTRVFSQKLVNLILMPDNGTPLPMTSVAFFPSRREADEYRAVMGAEKRGLFLTAWR